MSERELLCRAEKPGMVRIVYIDPRDSGVSVEVPEIELDRALDYVDNKLKPRGDSLLIFDWRGREVTALWRGFQVKERLVQCRFGCDSEKLPALARYHFPGGCACHPDDREQDLCGQHIISSEPLEGSELMIVYNRIKYVQFMAAYGRLH